MYEAFEPHEGGRTWKFKTLEDLARKIAGKSAGFHPVQGEMTGPRHTMTIGHPSGGSWSVNTQVRVPAEAWQDYLQESQRRANEDTFDPDSAIGQIAKRHR